MRSVPRRRDFAVGAVRVRTVWMAAAVGVAPLFLAVWALSRTDWFPIGDLAQATLRQQSFWSHPPLVGTAGRIGTFARQGNHPGPAMFWLAWPMWRLLGGSSWALEASVAILATGAYVAMVWAGIRHLGTRVGLALAVVGAILFRSFGASSLTQPWNPYMPLVPYLLFVVLCWAALCGRVLALPLAVAVGSYCVQCHVGYAPAVAAGIGVAVIGVIADQVQAHRSRASDGDDPDDHTEPALLSGRRIGVTVLVAVLTGVVMWIPPVIDQIVHDPGNLRILVQTFRAQTGHLIGLRQGGHILLTQLDPVGNWLLGTRRIQGSIVGGVLLLLAWGASVLVARRERNRVLLRLHIVLGVQVMCALYWAVRLDSTRYLYLVEWFWVLTGLMVLSVGWGGLLLARRFRPRWQADRRWPAVAGVALVVTTVVFAATAVGITPHDLRYSRTVQAIAGPTEAKLSHDHSYLVNWVDPDALGGNGFGLFLQLDRAGYDVHAGTAFSAALEPWRVRDEQPGDTVLTVVSGDANIAKARDQPGVEELVAADHRTAAQRRHYRLLQRRAMAQLRAMGRDDLATTVSSNIWVARNDPDISNRTFDILNEMLRIGQGTSVFASSGPLAL